MTNGRCLWTFKWHAFNCVEGYTWLRASVNTLLSCASVAIQRLVHFSASSGNASQCAPPHVCSTLPQLAMFPSLRWQGCSQNISGEIGGKGINTLSHQTFFSTRLLRNSIGVFLQGRGEAFLFSFDDRVFSLSQHLSILFSLCPPLRLSPCLILSSTLRATGNEQMDLY